MFKSIAFLVPTAVDFTGQPVVPQWSISDSVCSVDTSMYRLLWLS